MVKQRMLIASNHQRFRYELSRLVQLLDPCIEVVGEAATSFDVLVCSVELRPDLVLLDLTLRPGNALDLVTHIHRLSPITAVVVISNEPDADYRQAAIEAGALDYLDVLELTTMLPAALELVNGRANSHEKRSDDDRTGTAGGHTGATADAVGDCRRVPRAADEATTALSGIGDEF